MTRIFTATLGTETNTFSALPTGLQLFEETCLFRRRSYGEKVPMFGAPLEVWRRLGEARGWEVVEGLCAFAMPAGKTVKRVYEGFRDEILADLKAALPVDAVLLSLHGAMVAEGYDDAEGDLLAHVRRLVGPGVPVGAELDLHGNVGRQKLENATAIVLFKEYPHIDVPERAEDLFHLIADVMAGRTKPVMGWFDCRTVGIFHTTRQPMRGFVDKCAALEGKDGVLSVSVVHGFPWADVEDMGSKIVVVTDGNKEKAERLAEELGMEFFRLRKETQPSYTSLDQAMARALRHNQAKPLILADVSDNAGGGAASDSTFILKAMLEKGVRQAAIGMFWDPMAVRIAFEAGEGASLDLRLGGKLGPSSGPPLDLRATVTGLKRDAYVSFGGREKSFIPVGDMAAFEVEGISVVCNTLRSQCKSVDCFTHVGVDPAAKRVVVVKSMQHFHAAYAPVASEILYVAVPGAVAPDFLTMPYHKAPKRQWPFIDDPFAKPGA
ncbi:MAG: M81 family metallopeptidase [Alphaproteobacteria bacterium]|nr:M81 family metallopeptidase [Alphaproteobacteria bacterium]